VDHCGKPEIVCSSEGCIRYAEADWEHPDQPWIFRPILQKSGIQRFTRRLRFRDVIGDERIDNFQKGGQWEQPASLENHSLRTKHPFQFGEGGAQMFTYDVNGADLNGDKMPDIIVSNKKAALCSCRNSRSRNLWKAIDGENCCGRIRSGIS
jgi:hypothetical protein